MHREYQRWFSRTLGRDMEMLVFGHSGRPVIVFPTSMGTFKCADPECKGASWGRMNVKSIMSADGPN